MQQDGGFRRRRRLWQRLAFQVMIEDGFHAGERIRAEMQRASGSGLQPGKRVFVAQPY